MKNPAHFRRKYSRANLKSGTAGSIVAESSSGVDLTSSRRAAGEIGKRKGLRILRRKACGFKSRAAHQFHSRGKRPGLRQDFPDRLRT